MQDFNPKEIQFTPDDKRLAELSTSHQNIPQYAEVPPNTEAK
jgi:hypothetical protein